MIKHYSFLMLLAMLLAGNAFAKNNEWQSKNVLSFVENKGQITDQYGVPRSDIGYRVNTPGVSVFVGAGQIHYQWNKETTNVSFEKNKHNKVATYRMDVALLNANNNAPVVATEKQIYYEQYKDKNLVAHSYNKITYKDVYPNIDWVLYIKDNTVEYDFNVRPGGNVADIQVQYNGVTTLNMQKNGSLVVTTPMGSVTEHAPASFQQDGALVASSFTLKNNVVGFDVANYTGALKIDPVLEWSTYYGGSGQEAIATSIYCDDAGNVYMAGSSPSTAAIATTGSYSATLQGGSDAYVAKFNKAGVRIWATYYGGTDEDNLLSVRGSGKYIYIAGYTFSTTNIATANAYQTAIDGFMDGFIAKFDSSGNIIWGTYVGGEDGDVIQDMTIDDAGNLYVVGNTSSTMHIATTGAFRDTLTDPANMGTNGFLIKFDSSGKRKWGTYYPTGELYNVLSDGAYIYIASTAYLPGLATAGSYQDTLGGTNGQDDVFLAQFDTAGKQKWCTYYGGEDAESASSSGKLAKDGHGNIYLTGTTGSSGGIATTGAYQTTLAGGEDLFIVKFNATGTPVWATYYGGTSTENGGYIAADRTGNFIVAGDTRSGSGIATPGSYKAIFSGSSSDGFFGQFTGAGKLQYGTYFGGTSIDVFTSVAIDNNNGSIYVGGNTQSSSNVSTTNAHQPLYGSGARSSDNFFTKWCGAPAPVIKGADSICHSLTGTLTYSIDKADTTKYLWTLPAGWSGASDSTSIIATPNGNGGIITVRSIKCNDTTVQTKTVVVHSGGTPLITVSGFDLSTAQTHLTYQWLLGNAIIPGATSRTYTVTQNGDYRVAVTNPGGCLDTSALRTITNVLVNDQHLNTLISVYPNPVTNVLNITSPVTVNISLCNMEGRTVLQQNAAKAINVANLPHGIYILKIYDERGNIMKNEKIVRVAE